MRSCVFLRLTLWGTTTPQVSANEGRPYIILTNRPSPRLSAIAENRYRQRFRKNPFGITDRKEEADHYARPHVRCEANDWHSCSCCRHFGARRSDVGSNPA